MLLLLLDSALRAAVLALAVGFALKLFRVRNPHIALTAWTIVLVAALAMPLLVRISPLSVSVPARVVSQTPPVLAELPLQISPRASDPQGVMSTDTPVQGIPKSADALDWRTLVIAAYLAIAGVLAARLGMACLLAWRLLLRARPVTEAWARGLNVRISDAFTMPATVGATVLLPTACLTWPSVKRDAVLLHERCHVARGDFYIQFLAAFHRAVFWFSPLAWWLETRLAELSETTSDDAAIAVMADRMAYAEILLDVSRTVRGETVGIAMARPATVKGRIKRILSQTAVAMPVSLRKRAAIAASLVPAIGLATLGITSAVAQPPQNMAVLFAPKTLQPAVLEKLQIARAVFLEEKIVVPAAPLVVVAEPVESRVEYAAATVDVVPPAPVVQVASTNDNPACVRVNDVEKTLVVDPKTILATLRSGGGYRLFNFAQKVTGLDNEATFVFNTNEGSDVAVNLCANDTIRVLGRRGGAAPIEKISVVDDAEAGVLRVRAVTEEKRRARRRADAVRGDLENARDHFQPPVYVQPMSPPLSPPPSAPPAH